MDYYIAASFPNREIARALALRIRQGTRATIRARWLDSTHTTYGDDAKFSIEDEQDVIISPGLVVITGDKLTLGGRHTELGIALGAATSELRLFANPAQYPTRHICLLGPREQVFHHHPRVNAYETQEKLIEAINDFHIRYGR